MQSGKKQNRITDTIESTLKNLSELIDVNTVIGGPISTGDYEVVFPISKVTVGVLMGGGEYGKTSIFKSSDDLPFSAGNGAIISLKPCGFLVKNKDNYKILSVSDNYTEKLIEKATDFISELKYENK